MAISVAGIGSPFTCRYQKIYGQPSRLQMPHTERQVRKGVKITPALLVQKNWGAMGEGIGMKGEKRRRGKLSSGYWIHGRWAIEQVEAA